MPPSYAFLSLTRAKPSIYAPLIVPESFLAPLQDDTPGNAFGTYRRPRVQRGTLGRHFRTILSLGITAEDPPVSKSHCFAHETTSEDPSVSRTRRFAHETTSEDPPVSRTRRLAHEITLADHSVSRTRYFAHENDSEDPPVSRSRLFTHETAAKDTRGNRGAFSASYGDSMGTLRALLDAAEVRPEPMGLVIGLSAFRNRHLDG